MIKITAMLIVLIVFIGVASYFAAAEPPPIKPRPTPIVSGGGNSYTPPTFVPYTKPINSSDGTTIGYIEGKDFNSVDFFVHKNGTVNGTYYNLTITGVLSHDPPDGSLVDISFEPGEGDGLPEGLGYGTILARANVTMSPADGWAFRSGPHHALNVSGDVVDSLDPGTALYVAWFDGSQYQIRKLQAVIDAGVASFEFYPQGNSGICTIYSAAVPAPTPTLEPAPTNTPTPVPQGGVNPMLLVIFVVVLVVVAALAFFLGTRFK